MNFVLKSRKREEFVSVAACRRLHTRLRRSRGRELISVPVAVFVSGLARVFSVRAYFVYTHCKGVRVFTHVDVCIHRYVASPVCQGWAPVEGGAVDVLGSTCR